MRKFRINRLVRDKIIANIQSRHSIPHFHQLNQQDYIKELKEKLIEETTELQKEVDDAHLTQEIADVQEVLDHLIETAGLSRDRIAEEQKIKRDNHGAFQNRDFLEIVELHDDDPWLEYYLAHPDKFTEIND